MRGSYAAHSSNQRQVNLNEIGANHMDGPVGINQCAIKPGKMFTYRVPTDDQAGTFW